MLYEFNTKLQPEEIMLKAKEFFGAAPGGLGMELATDDICCVTLVGGGGRVSISATAGKGHTVVNVETSEWDQQVKQFLKKYAH